MSSFSFLPLLLFLRHCNYRLTSIIAWDRLPLPPTGYQAMLRFLVGLRKFLLRHLLLPRPYFLRRKYLLDSPQPFTGRYNVARWQVHPWYVKPSFQDLWGLRAWLRWARGGALPGHWDDKFLPAGYRLREVGPAQQIGKGETEMNEMIETLKAKCCHC